MLDIRDIHSLSDFKRKTSEFMVRMRDTGNPVVLTVNGSARLVVQDAEAYQRLVERVEAIEGIKSGLEAFKQGKGIPALEALKRVRRKHGIPRRNRP